MKKGDKAIPGPVDRTEEEKLVQAPLVVILGGKEYEIRPLVIRDSREWRKKVGPWQAALSRYAGIKSDEPEAFETALTELLVDRIDQTVNFFFDYARDLPREEIESVATEGEIVVAFNEVIKFAFPFD